MSPNGRPRVSGLRIMQIVLALVGVGVIAMGVLVGVLFGRVHAQFAAINNERAATVLLIDALTPKRDCAALAHRQVDTTP